MDIADETGQSGHQLRADASVLLHSRLRTGAFIAYLGNSLLQRQLPFYFPLCWTSPRQHR